MLNRKSRLKMGFQDSQRHFGTLFPQKKYQRYTGILVLLGMGLGLWVSCSSVPSAKHKNYQFPKEQAFFGDVKHAYKTLGVVRAKAEYLTLDMSREESELCVNYFNKAVKDLVEMAKDKGGDAVIDVKSVVFLADGRTETFTHPECADDGMEGQALAQGIAIKWLKSE